ncbi:MAG: hypothetical protein WBC51_00705 [Vicinamibacterales bacterium]
MWGWFSVATATTVPPIMDFSHPSYLQIFLTASLPIMGHPLRRCQYARHQYDQRIGRDVTDPNEFLRREYRQPWKLT